MQEAHTWHTLLVWQIQACDPDELDHIIPGNDIDAIQWVKLIVNKMADAVIEANQGADSTLVEETNEVTSENTDEQ